MKHTKTFFLSVAPLTAIPLAHGSIFTYTAEDAVPVGSLVDIPFGKRNVRGIVLDQDASRSQETPAKTKNLKKISSVIVPAFLTPEQVALAHWMAHEYFTSLGKALKLFIPDALVAEKKKKSSKHSTVASLPQEDASPQKIKLTPEQRQAVRAMTRAKKPVLLTGEPSSGKTEVLIETARFFLKKKKQILFLFPEIALTPHTAERLKLRLGENLVHTFHSACSLSERRRLYQLVASGTPCVIAGSRSALFLPFASLGLVIVDEEHDDGHKQSFRAPRFDARRIAEKLASFHGASLLKSSSTPSCEAFQAVRNKTLDSFILPPAQKHFSVSKEIRVHAVDMRLLHWKNKQKRLDPPVISDELRSLLLETLRKKSQAIVLVSRQGMNAFSLCTHCKNIFRCPKCERALVAQRSGHFLCLGGHFRTPAFPKCPHCGGLSFTGHGVGTQKAEEALTRLFPHARIARADAQTFRHKKNRDELFRKMTSGSIDILIGTQMIAKGWDLPHLACVAVIDTDTFFSFPDFSNDARAAQLFFQARGRLGRIGNTQNGTLLLQTYHTDRPLFRFLKDNTYPHFLEEELETRKLLEYPPFSRLIRVYAKNKNDDTLRSQALDIFKRLAILKSETMHISRPAKSLKREKPGLFCRHIILKYTTPDIPEELTALLEKLPGNWYVDRDPLSIL